MRSDTIVSDIEGSDFTDFGEAQDYAVRSARELIAQTVLAGEVIKADRIEITDEKGLVEASIALQSVVVFGDPAV
jgi:hypothetical protein